MPDVSLHRPNTSGFPPGVDNGVDPDADTDKPAYTVVVDPSNTTLAIVHFATHTGIVPG